MPALYAYVVELTWLERREGLEHRWYQWEEMHHAVGWRPDKQNADRHCCQVLLELEAPVHRDEHVVLGRHPSEKLAVRDASPATADHGIDSVALEYRGKVYRELLVKKNAHRPTA